MGDLKERLRKADELRMPDVWSEARRRFASGELREGRLREGPSDARRAVAALVAFAVFAAGGTLLWRASRSAPPEVKGPTPSPEPAVDVLAELPRGWTELASPPDVRCCAATAWTGAELLVWSGYVYTGLSDEVAEPNGFRFDPISGRTAPIGPSPLGPRSVPASAWTGQELLVWGGQDAAGTSFYDDGAAYDPATDTWRVLPPSPLSARVPLSVWTGSEWILWGTGVRRDDRPLDGAAYVPATDTWRSIASGPVELTDATAAWTGTEMIVFGAALHGGNVPETPTAVAAAYDPRADTWRTLPPSPLDPNSNTAVWNGSELIALDYNHDSAAYDPQTDRWRDLGRVPGDDCEGGLSGSVSIDGDVLAIDCGYAIFFREGSEGWADVTPASGIHGFAFLPFATTQPMPAALVYGWDDDDFEPSGMFAYRPSPRDRPDIDLSPLQGNDPIIGKWSIAFDHAGQELVLVVEGGLQPASILVRPLEEGDIFGDWLVTARSGDALLLVQLADPAVTRAVLRFEDGTEIEATVRPVSSEVIGDVSVIVAGFRGLLSAEGQHLDPNGYVVAFDSSGSQLGRISLVEGK
jgi:hypothetical protein